MTFSLEIKEGMYFGELGLVFDKRRTANVRAVTNSEVCKLDKEDFFEVLNRFPEYAVDILLTGAVRAALRACLFLIPL